MNIYHFGTEIKSTRKTVFLHSLRLKFLSNLQCFNMAIMAMLLLTKQIIVISHANMIYYNP